MQKKLVFAIFLLKFVSSETNDLKLVFADFMRNQVFQNPDEHKAYFEGSKIVGCQGQNLSYDEFAHEITDKMDRRLGFNITLSSIVENKPKNGEILAEYLIFENFQNPAEILKQTINVIYRNSGSLISEVKATCEIIN